MSIRVEYTNDIQDGAKFLALSIAGKLALQKKVLWFVTGGSSIKVALGTAQILSKYPENLENLTVMLTDERYGATDHPESNWQQLLNGDFNIPNAKLIPILTGEDREVTTKKFNKILKEEFENNEYKIGLFGVGADGHTAGILAHSVAVSSPDLAVAYDTEKFERITITPQAIAKLDEVAVFMQGQEKWKVAENLIKDNMSIAEQPAQVLKKVHLLTLFTDYTPE